MGAVVSCFQAVFRAIGNCIMAVVHAIASILEAIINGIVALFDIIIGCITCQRFGGRKRRMGGRHHNTVTV